MKFNKHCSHSIPTHLLKDLPLAISLPSIIKFFPLCQVISTCIQNHQFPILKANKSSQPHIFLFQHHWISLFSIYSKITGRRRRRCLHSLSPSPISPIISWIYTNKAFISTISLKLLSRSPVASALLNLMLRVSVLVLLDLPGSKQKSWSFPLWETDISLAFQVLQSLDFLPVPLAPICQSAYGFLLITTTSNSKPQVLNLLSSHTQFLGEVDLAYDFKLTSKFNVYCLALSPEYQSHIFSYLINVSTWMPIRHLKFIKSTTKILIFSLNLLPLVFSNWANVHSILPVAKAKKLVILFTPRLTSNPRGNSVVSTFKTYPESNSFSPLPVFLD